MTIEPARKREAGQVLPLLVLALVGLLGFAALALDGGNLYTEQRRAQAAADNAVMAAALQEMNGITGNSTQANFDCASINVNDPAQAAAVPLALAACHNASQNGYTASDPHTTVVFHLPPVHGAYAGNSQYMEVVITQTVPTALAHLVYGQDPIPVTVIAVAHGTPTGPIMPGYALSAMKPDCGSGGTIYMQSKGGGSGGGASLTDGGAFVNANCPSALKMTGGDTLMTNGPPIDVVGDPSTVSGTPCTSPGVPSGCNYYPAPTTSANGGVPLSQDLLQGTPAGTPPTAQDCAPARNLATEMADPVGIHPGSYTTLDSGNASINLRPGIYCLTGGTLSSGNGSMTGNGVLIYLVDTAASIVYSGKNSASLDLSAPTTATTGCQGTADPSQDICKYLGIVVYKVTGTNLCLDNAPDIVFTGNGSMNVVGLVYAPLSLVKYGGNGSLTMTGQTIAGCVKFNGNGNLNIVYNPTVIYSPPPSIRLDQ